jgi:hypothetical protein
MTASPTASASGHRRWGRRAPHRHHSARGARRICLVIRGSHAADARPRAGTGRRGRHDPCPTATPRQARNPLLNGTRRGRTSHRLKQLLPIHAMRHSRHRPGECSRSTNWALLMAGPAPVGGRVRTRLAFGTPRCLSTAALRASVDGVAKDPNDAVFGANPTRLIRSRSHRPERGHCILERVRLVLLGHQLGTGLRRSDGEPGEEPSVEDEGDDVDEREPDKERNIARMNASAASTSAMPPMKRRTWAASSFARGRAGTVGRSPISCPTPSRTRPSQRRAETACRRPRHQRRTAPARRQLAAPEALPAPSEWPKPSAL